MTLEKLTRDRLNSLTAHARTSVYARTSAFTMSVLGSYWRALSKGVISSDLWDEGS